MTKIHRSRINKFNLTDSTVVSASWIIQDAPADTAYVSEAGREAISQLLRSWSISKAKFSAAWDWTINPSGADRNNLKGKIAKRIASVLFKYNGIKLSDDQIAKIGATAANNAVILKYEMRFTRTFNWKSGDYGDSGSCFWGGRARARSIMRNSGGLAVLFRNDGAGKRARAWIAPRTPSANSFIVYNAYGNMFTGDSTRAVAELLANRYGLKVKQISLCNQDMSVGTLWINGNRDSVSGDLIASRGTGYICAPANEIETLPEEFDLNYPDPSIKQCSVCQKKVTTQTDGEFGSVSGVNRKTYCRKCFDKHFIRCYDCSRAIDPESEHMSFPAPYDNDTLQHLCPRCVRKRQCSICHEFTLYDHGSDFSQRLCERCSRVPVECEHCHHTTQRQNIVHFHNNHVYCYDCSFLPIEELDNAR